MQPGNTPRAARATELARVGGERGFDSVGASNRDRQGAAARRRCHRCVTRTRSLFTDQDGTMTGATHHPLGEQHTPDELLAFLELEHIDGDIYRGPPTIWRREGSLYGGLVAAQALMAAALTVPDGRSPHSLHGYFLRPGDPDRPVVFSVDRDRDGRSFWARRVAAMQDGEVIWSMACSFHAPVEGPEYVPSPRVVLAPENSELLVQQHHPLLDIRVPRSPDDDPVAMPIDQGWVRVNVPLDDEPLVHACMHVYTSDLTTGFAALAVDGVPPAGSSIDHALWFHRFGRADDWVFYDCTPQKVGNHRGVYTGTAHDREGNLLAILAQEMLLRPPRDTNETNFERRDAPAEAIMTRHRPA